MKNNNSKSDHIFDYMKSKLVSHLRKTNPEFLSETDYIAMKADKATILYNKLIKEGIDKKIAKKEALVILLENNKE